MQGAPDIEAEEDMTVGEHWLPYLDVEEMIYGKGEFRKQIRHLEGTTIEQLSLSMSSRASKSPEATCQEDFGRQTSDAQEAVQVNPTEAKPVTKKVKEYGISDREISSPDTRPPSQHVSFKNVASAGQGLGQRFSWRLSWHKIKGYDFCVMTSELRLTSGQSRNIVLILDGDAIGC